MQKPDKVPSGTKKLIAPITVGCISAAAAGLSLGGMWKDHFRDEIAVCLNKAAQPRTTQTLAQCESSVSPISQGQLALQNLRLRFRDTPREDIRRAIIGCTGGKTALTAKDIAGCDTAIHGWSDKLFGTPEQ